MNSKSISSRKGTTIEEEIAISTDTDIRGIVTNSMIQKVMLCQLSHAPQLLIGTTTIKCFKCSYEWLLCSNKRWIKDSLIHKHVAALELLLRTNLDDNSYEDRDDDDYNWQATFARNASHRILSVSNCTGLGGCKLCQS